MEKEDTKPRRNVSDWLLVKKTLTRPGSSGIGVWWSAGADLILSMRKALGLIQAYKTNPALAAKPGHPRSIPKIHMTEGEHLGQAVVKSLKKKNIKLVSIFLRLLCTKSKCRH